MPSGFLGTILFLHLVTFSFYWRSFFLFKGGVYVKVAGNIKEMTVSQSALSKALGVTPSRVNQLIQEKVVVRDESDKSGAVMLFDSIRNYYSSKKISEEGVDYWKEHGKHEKAKRELAELKLEKERGKLYEAKTVELAMTEQLVMLRTKLLGIPTKLAPILEGKDKDTIFSIINSEIEENLSEMSKYNPDMFKEEIEDGTGGDASED